MYGHNLATTDGIRSVCQEDSIGKEPIKIGARYVVATPVEDGDNSIFMGETVEVFDVAEGGFSFRLKVKGDPNRVVIIPASVALISLSLDE
jgi:hypothetical protein